MSNFLDPIKMAFREAMAEAAAKSEEKRITQAFRNGIYVGIVLGASAVTVVWGIGILSP